MISTLMLSNVRLIVTFRGEGEAAHASWCHIDRSAGAAAGWLLVEDVREVKCVIAIPFLTKKPTWFINVHIKDGNNN